MNWDALSRIGWAPIARIVLRYLIGLFTAYALLTPEVGEELVRDPDMQVIVEVALGTAAGAIVEGFYWAAKRFRWRT